MARFRIRVEPTALTRAVQQAGWSEEEIKQKAPSFDRWLEGSRQPTPHQLVQFSADTNVPLEEFLRRPTRELSVPDLRPNPGGRLESPSENLADTLELCLARQRWFREHGPELGATLPTLAGQGDRTQSAAEVGRRILAELGWSRSERGRWPSWVETRLWLVGQLEQCGMLVMVSGIYGSNSHRSLNPDEFKSIALFDPVAPVLFLNARDRPDRQIFTLMHALAHLWLGESALCAPAVESREELDQWADELAAEVLAPRDWVRADFRPGGGSEEVARLAQSYRVNRLVVERQLAALGEQSWEELARASADEQDRLVPQTFFGDPDAERGFYRHVEVRVGVRFTRTLLAGWRQGIASESEVMELLGIKEPQVLRTLAERLGTD